MTNPAPSCDIVITKFLATELKVDFSEPPIEFNRSTAVSIYNAWMQTAMVDNYGMVWILPSRLGEILRTSKSGAYAIVQNTRREHRRSSAEGTYLRYSEVSRILSDIIQSAGTLKRERYAGYSESIGRAIRDSDKAVLQRALSYAATKETKRQLKSKRLRTLSPRIDELTNEPLAKTCEFSHIRSCAVYPSLSTNVWNGLIVNKTTHNLITDRQIYDENRLLQLCYEQNWNTKWYRAFKADLSQLN
ncbi:hypothetical protein [Chamaesiphon sp. VAR_48_metabat_403]|uniref:hypothetical protein n=1 Tax=Chamaesiphon sp. VAR_48_metabat_403 TaxID=2964700 RepID=UPI00286E1B7A|nr:hypothetical protein [Chamaesiphon sp. VAR_48_metabat_403]